MKTLTETEILILSVEEFMGLVGKELTEEQREKLAPAFTTLVNRLNKAKSELQ